MTTRSSIHQRARVGFKTNPTSQLQLYESQLALKQEHIRTITLISVTNYVLPWRLALHQQLIFPTNQPSVEHPPHLQTRRHAPC